MNNRTHDEFPSAEGEKKRVELYFGLRPPEPRRELEGKNTPTNELNKEPKKSSPAARLVAKWKAEGRIKPTEIKLEPQQPGQMLPPEKQQDEEVKCGYQASRSPAREGLSWRRKVRISRRTILALYGISVATSCLWVPWKLELSRVDFRPTPTYFVGYSTPWSQPKPRQIRSNVPILGFWSDASIESLRVTLALDWQRVALEWIFLTALAGVAFLLTPISVPLPIRRSPSPIVQAQEVGQAKPNAPQESQAAAPRVRPYRFGTFLSALMIIWGLLAIVGLAKLGITGTLLPYVLAGLTGLAVFVTGIGLLSKKRWAYRFYMGYVVVIGIAAGFFLLLALGTPNDSDLSREAGWLIANFLFLCLPAIYFFRRRREFV